VSRRLIGYPTGWTLAVFDDAEAAAAAARALESEGVPRDDLVVLAGTAGEGLDRLGSSSGIGARVRRAMQFMTMDQLPDLHVYELALERAQAVVGVRLADEHHRRAAIATIQRHGGHFINRFGAWATEEIAPWRGPMPDLPQHMQR
jgi:hypothetical protein